MTVHLSPNFIPPTTLAAIQREAHAAAHKAYFTATPHTVFLTPPDPSLPDGHVRNRMVTSSKGCICDDDVPADSPLRALYESDDFRAFIMEQTGETALYPYADPLSSINVHYARRGQELGWHFDNSEFAITLLIQKPDAGGRFEYVPGLRDSATGEVDEEGIAALLDGRLEAAGGGDRTRHAGAVSRARRHPPRLPQRERHDPHSRRPRL